MTGVPVVISENGYGIAVKPVEGGAPVLTVAESGIPIVISDRGAPFIVDGYSPDTNPLVPMTIFAGADGTSGDNGFRAGSYGSISNEPLSGHTLIQCAVRAANHLQLAFSGDCVSIVSGWAPQIAGISVVQGIVAWEYDSDTDETSATWECQGMMSEGQQYSVTWVKA